MESLDGKDIAVAFERIGGCWYELAQKPSWLVPTRLQMP